MEDDQATLTARLKASIMENFLAKEMTQPGRHELERQAELLAGDIAKRIIRKRERVKMRALKEELFRNALGMRLKTPAKGKTTE